METFADCRLPTWSVRLSRRPSLTMVAGRGLAYGEVSGNEGWEAEDDARLAKYAADGPLAACPLSDDHGRFPTAAPSLLSDPSANSIASPVPKDSATLRVRCGFSGGGAASGSSPLMSE